MRKHAFTIIGTLVAIVVVLTACSSPAAAPTAAPTKAAAAPAAAPTQAASAAPAATVAAAPAATAQPAAASKPTGELKVAVGALGTGTFDPTSALPSDKFWHRMAYDTVIGSLAERGKLELSKDAGLARDWQLTPDAMKLTLNLRKGVKFHNGDEVTADDVKFELERAIRPESKSTNAGSFRAAIKSIQALDPYTVVIDFKQPSPLLSAQLSELGGLEAEVYPKKLLEQKGDLEFFRNPVGTGPYKVVENVPTTRIVFEAFDDHWRGAPKYKKVTLLNVPEESTRLTMLKRGEVDVVDVSRETAADIKKAGFNVFAKEDASIYRTIFVMGKKAQAAGAPVTKLPVRQALSLAINRKEIVDALFYGQATAVGTQYGSYTMEYQPVPPDPYDPQKAKQLLAQAGYPNGFPLDYYTFPVGGSPEMMKINEVVAGYWKAIGVDVKLKPTDLNGWIEMLRKGDLQYGSAQGYPYPNQYLTLPTYQGSYHPKGANPYFSAGDDFFAPELSAMVDKAFATIDDKERIAIQRQMMMYLHDNVLIVPLVSISAPFATKSDIKAWDLGKRAYDFNLIDLIRTW